MRQFTVALWVLAISPGLVLIAVVHTLDRGAMSWIFLIGCLALLGPLAYLSFAKSPFREEPRARRWIWLAAASCVVALPGIAMVEAPGYLIAGDPGEPIISLRPPSPDRVHAHGGYEVTGLNVRYPPLIGKEPWDAGYGFRVTLTSRGGESSTVPPRKTPRKMEDGFGNHVAILEKRPGVLRLEDNLGGFAEVDWSGQSPVLLASRAFPRTPSARGPRPIARRVADVGSLVLIFSLLTAWMLLTTALTRLPAFSSPVLWWSLRLQQVALAIFLLSCLILWALGPPDIGNLGDAQLVGSCLMIPAAGMSVAGLVMMSICLIQSAWARRGC